MLFVPFYTMVFPLLGHHLEPVQAVEVGLLTEIFGFLSSTSAFWRAGLIDFRSRVLRPSSPPHWLSWAAMPLTFCRETCCWP